MAPKKTKYKKKEEIEILIDDAGSGNFVGGMVISGYAEAIDKYKSVVIQPQDYNDTVEDMQQKTLKCVKEIIDYFSEYSIISVFLCQSNLFDLSALHLVDCGYVVLRGRIEGKLQDIIEYDFLNHLKELGLPHYIDFYAKIISRDKNSGYRILNNFCINYIKIDLQKRLAICKSRTKLFEDLAKAVIHRDIIENRFGAKPKLCCNCGKYINDKELFKHTTSNFNSVFYTHIHCLTDTAGGAAKKEIRGGAGSPAAVSSGELPF